MELVNITYAGEGKQPVELNPIDSQLVNSNFINSAFGAVNDYMELYIYDENGNLLSLDYDAFDYYPYLTSNPQNNTYSTLALDPEKDLKNRGFDRGNLTVQYNFFTKLFNSQFGTLYWIKEISTSRKELKLASQVLSTENIRTGFLQYQSYINVKNYYPIFYLNFGNNQIISANNVAFTEDEEGGYLLVKLYEPLPADFDIKTQLWLVDKVAESVSFNVNIQVESGAITQVNRLRGPNFNVRLNTKNGQTTPYYNYNNLLASPVTSSFQKLLSYYQDKSVELNVDYSDFSNFIHWSSAVERVNNFTYKLELIEGYKVQEYSQSLVTGSSQNILYASSSIGSAQQAINNIIKNFDTYEYFLYFDSSSWAWPKSNTTQPYNLYSVTSSVAKNFLGGIGAVPTATTQSLLWSASYYDATNKDILRGSVPQYLLDDSSNQPYITFIDMVGQHFDNIWIYYKDLSNRYNATNDPNTGISLDVVSDALRNFGIQLYTNTNVSDNLYYALFGINQDGSLLPPTGSELITNYVTSSLTTLPAETIQDEIYKRLYHNLPYLLKTKGTERGVKALIATYGIPDSILTVREFGGNVMNQLDGVFDVDTGDYKIIIDTGSLGNVTGSLTLSSSLLSPHTTIQYYDKNNRINTPYIEVGFSPADVINTNITSSQGYFDINQMIGKPSDQYSSSYKTLDDYSQTYFSSYTQKNSIWEYVRLLKFYNNSIFKLVKDFIPARANVSTGIVIKSHMLERNKYARHEPSGSTSNNLSQSIELLSVTASEGGAISGSTYWTGFTPSLSGSIPYTSSQNQELYTGQFSGSTITVTDGNTFNDQWDISSISISASSYVTYSLGALYNNVTGSVISQIAVDLDYNSDQLKPVNYGIVTRSLNLAQTNNYAAYNNPVNDFAELQDYNYFLRRSTIPRYEGSQTVSRNYNTWSFGDSSYGKTAAIDKIKNQYAYLVDIYTSSMFFPGRSNAQIKYLIDNDENVLDLTKANKNIFSVQNLYKGGQTSNISLFNYDESNPYSQQLLNSPDTLIYEGGFRYLPILHNISGSSQAQTYILNVPERVAVIVTSTGEGLSPTSSFLQSSNWSIDWYNTETEVDYLVTSRFDIALLVTYNYGNLPAGVNVIVNVITGMQPDTSCDISPGGLRDIPIPVSSGQSFNSQGVATIYQAYQLGNGTSTGFASSRWPSGVANCTFYINTISDATSGGGGAGSTTSATYFTAEVTSSNPCVYLISASNQLVFNSTLAYYYNRGGSTFKSTSDPSFSGSTIDPVIFPFTLSTGDRISLYDSASRLAWNEEFEYVVKSFYITGSTNTLTSSAIVVDVDRPVNLALFTSASTVPTESVTGAAYRSCRYIVFKHIPDETNIILKYSPKDPRLTENGLIFPEYIDPGVRDNAGNVVKALKQQNLIT